MSLYGVIFYLLSALILVSTGLAITRRSQVHTVVYLVFSFFGTALLFYLLGAPLVAVLEVIIYAGAIMVLFLFVVMTQPRGEVRPFSVRRWMAPAVLAALTLGAGGLLLMADPLTHKALHPAVAPPAVFGEFLFTHYWLPVEIASFLLFVGLVGAYYLGRQQ